jgi:hypothetical protein
MHRTAGEMAPETRRCRAVVVAGAIALATLSLSMPTAAATPKNPNPAIPEKQIKKECEDPGLKGVYGTRKNGGDTVSTCDYLDGDGQYCSDEYINGVFQSTNCARVAGPTGPLQQMPGDPALSPDQPAPPPMGSQPLPPGGGSVSGQ